MTVGSHLQPLKRAHISSRGGTVILTYMLKIPHKEKGRTVPIPNTNLGILGQVSPKSWRKAQGVGPLNSGGLQSRKEWDCLRASYKNFQEGARPGVKPFSASWLGGLPAPLGALYRTCSVSWPDNPDPWLPQTSVITAR